MQSARLATTARTLQLGSWASSFVRSGVQSARPATTTRTSRSLSWASRFVRSGARSARPATTTRTLTSLSWANRFIRCGARSARPATAARTRPSLSWANRLISRGGQPGWCANMMRSSSDAVSSDGSVAHRAEPLNTRTPTGDISSHRSAARRDIGGGHARCANPARLRPSSSERASAPAARPQPPRGFNDLRASQISRWSTPAAAATASNDAAGLLRAARTQPPRHAPDERVRFMTDHLNCVA